VGWPDQQFPSSIFKTVQIMKIKNPTLPRSKNAQTLHGTIIEREEELSPLGQHQIPNRIHVINFGTLSKLKFP
jgi:hypothetical protein